MQPTIEEEIMQPETAEFTVLLIDDEVEFLHATAKALTRRGLSVRTAACAAEAREVLRHVACAVVVLDVRLPDADGHAFFAEVKHLQPETEVVMLTGHGDLGQAFELGRKGVFDYLGKPCEPAELYEVIQKAHAVSCGEYQVIAAEDNAQSGRREIVVLLVDDEHLFTTTLSKVLRRRNFTVLVAEEGKRALEVLATTLCDVAVVDVRMPGIDGLQLLRTIKTRHPATEVILLTGHATAESAVEGLKSGAYDYLLKPQDPEQLATVIRSAAESKRVHERQDRERMVDE